MLELELELHAPIPTTGKVERVAGWARAVVELHEHAPGRLNPRASARVACFGRTPAVSGPVNVFFLLFAARLMFGAERVSAWRQLSR